MIFAWQQSMSKPSLERGQMHQEEMYDTFAIKSLQKCNLSQSHKEQASNGDTYMTLHVFLRDEENSFCLRDTSVQETKKSVFPFILLKTHDSYWNHLDECAA